MLSNTATISAPQDDPQPADNSATDGDTELAPQAELALAKTGPAAAGTSLPLTYRLEVANGGTLAATSVTLVDILPPGSIFDSATAAGWACDAAAGVVTCTRAVLDPGAASSLTLVVLSPPTAGEVTNSALVSATEIDYNPANNSASWVTTIDPALIFSDGFESGDTSAWSSSAP